MSGEGNGTPLQYSCLENPMDGGAWWAAVHGVAKSPTRLSDFSCTFHFHALEKEMATRSSVLAWRIPGTGKPGGLPSMGPHSVGHDWGDLAAAALWAWWLTQGLRWNERGKLPPELRQHSLWTKCSCCLCETVPKGCGRGSLLACRCWWTGSSGEVLASLAGPLPLRLFLLSVPFLQPLRSPVGLPKVHSWVVCSHL